MRRFVGPFLLASVLAACSGSTDPDDGILAYAGSASVKSETPIVVAGAVTVRNTSESVVTIERNFCGYEMHLHWYGSSNSAPAWKSGPTTCPGVSLPFDLSPGNSYTFPLEASIPSNQRDGLHYLNVVNTQWKNGQPIRLGNLVIANGKAEK